MNKYGIFRPGAAVFKDALKKTARIFINAWSQRGIEVGTGVRISSSVCISGPGCLQVNDGATLGAGVIIALE